MLESCVVPYEVLVWQVGRGGHGDLKGMIMVSGEDTCQIHGNAIPAALRYSQGRHSIGYIMSARSVNVYEDSTSTSFMCL